MKNSQSGFTLLEMVMVGAMTTILVVLLSDFFVGRMLDYTRNETQVILQSNTKQAIETMERDIKSAVAVEANNTFEDANSPAAPSNLLSWASTTSEPATIVLAVPAKDTNGNLLYVDPLRNSLHTNDVIYYVDSVSKILFRRVVANPVSGNAAKTTCPPAEATPSCPSDSHVVENVANLKATYYNGENQETATPSQAGSILFEVTQTRERLGRVYRSTLVTRASLRN